MRICPGWLGTRTGSVRSRSSSTCRSSALAPETAKPTGSPCRVATRCTRPSGWCQAADRWPTAERAVAASSVVVLEPGGKGGGALVVAGERLPVGPLGDQGAVESFDLAVLPGAVRLDELLPRSERGAHALDGVLVGPGVVGHHPLDLVDAVAGEGGLR